MGSKVLRSFIAGFLVIPFVLSGVGAVSAAPVVKASTAKPVVVDSRPDEVSASITARVQGSRVEVASARTDSTRLWANSDGSFTVDQYSGPNWVQQSDGSWNELDATLVANGDSTFSPVETPMNVVVGSASAKVSDGQQGSVSHPAILATLSNLDQVSAAPDSASVSLGWAGDLPVPTVDGAVATYSDVNSNEDVRVKVLPTGVETFVDVASRPSNIGAGGYVTTLPLSAKGLKVRDNADGTVDVVDGAGQVVLEAPQAMVWDASVGELSGVSNNELSVNTELVKTAAGFALQVTVPAEYFDRLDLVYPVTIDPSVAATNGDTYVAKGYDTTNYASADQLRVGTFDAGVHVARAYLKFDFSKAPYFVNANSVVTDANLHIFQSYSATCSAREVDTHRATASWNPSLLTWANRTSYDGTVDGAESESHGFSSACPGAWLNGTTGISVKKTVSAWAASGYPTVAPNYGIVLDAANETDSLTWKLFYSSEYATSAKRPYVSYTFVHRPAQPSSVTIAGLGKASNGSYFSNAVNPKVSAAIGDVDGGKLSGRFLVNTAAGVAVGSVFYSDTQTGNGFTQAKATPATLTPGSSYKIRAWAWDGTYLSDPYTTTAGVTSPGYVDTPVFTIDTTAPTAGAIACTGLSLQTVVSSAPSSASCHVSASDGLSGIATTSFTVDDLPALVAKGTTPTVNLTPAMLSVGMHELTATVSDVAGNNTVVTSWYAIGDSALASPSNGYSSLGDVPITLVGPSGSSGHILEYSTDNGATYQPITKIYSQNGSLWNGSPVAWTMGRQTSGDLTWDMATELGTSLSRSIVIRGCWTGYSTGSLCGTTRVVRPVHGFGNAIATTDVGVGTVSLATGELSTSTTDVSVSLAGSSLSLGRSWLSVSDSSTPSAFGPGWQPQLPQANDGGLADATIVDTASTNGLISLQYAGGGEDNFQCSLNCSTDTATFTAIGDAQLAGLTLVRTASALTVTDSSFVVTQWARSSTTYTLPNVMDPATKTATSTRGPETIGTFAIDGQTFSGDTSTSVSLANGSSGITCALSSLASSSTIGLVPGCVGLTYVTAKVSTPVPTGSNVGDYPNRIRAVLLTLFDPASNAMVTKTVARYNYDSAGYLVAQWDPREALSNGNLVTQYGYGATVDGVKQLVSITPASVATASLVPTTITYDSAHRVSTVGRSGAGVTTLTYNPNLPTTTNGPDLTATTLSSLGQADLPTSSVEIFPPGATTSDIQQGTVYALDEAGRAVNTSNFGAGQWNTSITNYDNVNRVQFSMTPSNVARALVAAGLPDDPTGLPSTTVLARAQLLRSETVYSPNDPSLTIQTMEPISDFQTTAGLPASGRALTITTNDVDQQTPPGPATQTDAFNIVHSGPWHVATRVLRAMAVPSSQSSDGLPTDAASNKYDIVDPRIVTMGYDAISGGTPGWLFGTPTTVTTQMSDAPSTADISQVTKLDAFGRTIETRQPLSAGNDAGTMQTIYYSPGTNSALASCGNKPAWDGLVCVVRPASTLSATQTVPTKTLTYDLYGATKTLTETAGSASRVTTTTYDAGGRAINVAVAVTGSNAPTGSTSTSSTYWPNTGLPKDVTRGSQTVSYTYDTFGRTLTQVDSSGNTGSTTYDANGRVATTNDGITTTTYSYNGTDANGVTEYRDVVTAKTVASAIMNGTTISDAVFKAAYDADGSLSTQSLANGVTQNFTSNPTGQLTDMNYVAYGQTDAVASFNRVYDSSGQVVADNGVSKTATYSYDYAGRLISSQQTVDGTCQVHNYTFDKDSNRTNLQTLTNDDGSCPVDAASASTVTNSPSHSFDTGDRMFLAGAGIASNYVYDDLGNTTTLPSIDTTNTAGDVTLAYQPDSQVKSISQTGTVKTFTQDPLGRNVASVETATGAPTVTTVNYFDDSSDSPAWSVDSGLKWTRNISDLAGGLSVISSGTATSTAATSTKTLTSSSVQLTDMHGDVVTTMDATAGANTPKSTSAFDEYGAVLSSPTQLTYGWLGSRQRATTSIGLFLMGIRLYNPTIGRFLQADPIPGGTPAPFVYPVDPILGYDVSGCEDCDSITNTLRELLAELTTRYRELREDKNGLKMTGKNSIEGHRKQYREKQSRLRKYVRKYLDNNCGGPGGGMRLIQQANQRLSAKVPYPQHMDKPRVWSHIHVPKVVGKIVNGTITVGVVVVAIAFSPATA